MYHGNFVTLLSRWVGYGQAEAEHSMDNHVYKTVEITGSSSTSTDDAVRTISRASATVKNMRWFKVTETRGAIEDGKVGYWQVTIQLGFTSSEHRMRRVRSAHQVAPLIAGCHFGACASFRSAIP